MKIPALFKQYFIAWVACSLMLVNFFTGYNNAYAQDIARLEINELWNIPNNKLAKYIEQRQPDTVQIKLLLALAINLESKQGSFKTDIDSALRYLTQAENISNKLNNVNREIEIAENFGKVYYGYGNHTKGEYYYKKGIAICQQIGDKDFEAYLWGNMAVRANNPLKLAFYQQALKVYRQVPNKSKEIETLKDIADVHLNQGKFALADKELHQVLSMYKTIKFKQLHFTYDLLSALNRRRGDIDKALYYAIAAVQSCEAAKDTVALQTFYWRLGEAYQEAGNNLKSALYLEKSLDVLMRYPGPLLYHVLEELADQLTKNNETQKALDKILAVNKRWPPTDIHDKIALSFATADCYAALKNYAKAEKHYMQYADILGDGDDYFGALMKVSHFLIDQKKYARAGVYLNKLLRYKTGLPISRLRDVNLLSFKIDSAAGNLSAAISHLQHYNKLNAAIFTADKLKLTEELQVKFDLAGKEKDNQILRNQTALQEKALQNDRLIKNVTIAGCLILLLLIGLLYSRYRNKQKNNAELQFQKEEIRHAYQELEKTVGEKNKLLGEKEFLLKEIHHRVKNNLQLTMSLLNSQSSYLNNEEAISAIKESQHRLKSISLVHQKLYQADTIGRIDIKAYIHEIVAYLKESFNTGERIYFELKINDTKLDVGQAVSLGLFINEAITNVFKYAFPGRSAGIVQIQMEEKDPDHFILSITDNGVGLPEGYNTDQSNSLGITLMKGLSTQLGGFFAITSNKGVQIVMDFMVEPTLIHPAELAN